MCDNTEQLNQLIHKLEKIYQQWEEGRPKTENIDVEKIINKARADAFAGKKYEAPIIEPETIRLNLEPSELLEIMQGLLLRQCEIEAKSYIRDSLNKGISDRERWATVAEIMLLKEQRKKLRRRGGNELPFYYARVTNGFSANRAAEDVCKEFNFPTQEACNQWLRNEIKSSITEGVDIYKGLPKPEKTPKTKR